MNRTSLTRTIAPVASPVSVAQAKEHLRISQSETADDSMIQRYIEAATDLVERELGRVLVQQTWTLKLDAFPRGCGARGRFIELPKVPARSVSSITYVDTNGATQTLASDQYAVHADDWQPFVSEAYGVTWPSTRAQPDAVTVTFVAGYAPAGTSVDVNIPQTIKHAILLHVQASYDNLQASETQTLNATIKRLLAPYRVPVI